MDDSLLAELLKYVGATGAGGVITAFVVRFVYRKLVEEGAAAQRAAWEVEFIALLRAEIERLATVNRDLYAQAAEMHRRTIQLITENTEMKQKLAQIEAAERWPALEQEES